MKTYSKNVNMCLVHNFNVVINNDPGNMRATFDSATGAVIVGEVSTDLRNSVLHDLGYLSGTDLHKTFYKSWNDIVSRTDSELVTDQILHYMTTYGNILPGYVYLPYGDLNIPGNDGTLIVRVVMGVTEDEAAKRCVDMLNSGIALEEEILNEMLEVLAAIDVKYLADGFRNREANVIVARDYGILPKAPEEFIRYILLHATDSSLLIKDGRTVEAVRTFARDDTNRGWIKRHLEKYINVNGEAPLASVFNRFKPIFVAMKNHGTKKIINRLSKLSKTAHIPMVQNPLNSVTNRALLASDMHWVDNATVWAIMRSLDALQIEMHMPTHYAYRIRNGKVWAEEGRKDRDENLMTENRKILVAALRKRINGNGRKVYIPANIDYALPTSEKSFIGNVPALTKFRGKSLNVGIYWTDDMGANDLDLSAVSSDGNKVGWNGRYHDNDGAVIYSGDMTTAQNGAVEYLRFSKGCSDMMVYLNVYSGKPQSDYHVIVGDSPDKVTRPYMMNPNHLILNALRTTKNNQSVLGVVSETPDGVEFTVSEFDLNASSVSRGDANALNMLSALRERNKYRISLSSMLSVLGYVVTTDENGADVNLGIDNLSKDAIMALFKD